MQVPATVRLASPTARVPPAKRLPQTVLARQLALPVAKKLDAHDVHVRSAVSVGAVTSTRVVVPPSVVPAQTVTAATVP